MIENGKRESFILVSPPLRKSRSKRNLREKTIIYDFIPNGNVFFHIFTKSGDLVSSFAHTDTSKQTAPLSIDYCWNFSSRIRFQSKQCHTYFSILFYEWLQLFGFLVLFRFIFGLCVCMNCVSECVWVHIKFENMRPEHTSHVCLGLGCHDILSVSVVNLKYKWKLNKNHSLLQSDREKNRERKRVNKCVKGLFELMVENNQPEVEKRTTSTLFVSLSTGLSLPPFCSFLTWWWLFRKGSTEKRQRRSRKNCWTISVSNTEHGAMCVTCWYCVQSDKRERRNKMCRNESNMIGMMWLGLWRSILYFNSILITCWLFCAHSSSTCNTQAHTHAYTKVKKG